MNLTKDQEKAFDAIKRFMAQDEHKFMTLAGYAGTGKTTLLDYVVDYGHEKGLNIVLTAPTNQAVNVLRSKISLGDFSTIHSALDIKPHKEEQEKVFQFMYDDNLPINSYNFVIVDECSMIGKDILSYIQMAVEGNNTKVLFCGDPAQCQPVEDDPGISGTFKYPKVFLKEVVRHDDTLSKTALSVRKKTSGFLLDEIINGTSVVRIRKGSLENYFKDWHKNPNRARVLPWENVAVDKWNAKLRLIDRGETDNDFSIGDIVVANDTCLIKKGATSHVIMNNSEEGRVIYVKEFNEYNKLRVLKYNESEVELKVLKKRLVPNYKKKLNKLARKNEWYLFWNLKEKYHDIKHCYSRTIHKSQGSTFENVLIDYKNVCKSNDAVYRNQLIYTGMTRASTKVIFI